MRRAPLQRRTPLQRGTSRLKTTKPLTRRSRGLPRASERHLEYQAEIDALIPALMDRSKGICERCHDEPCGPRPHHRQRRTQSGKNTMANLVMLCWSRTGREGCHEYVHAHPTESFEQGWLIHG